MFSILVLKGTVTVFKEGGGLVKYFRKMEKTLFLKSSSQI